MSIYSTRPGVKGSTIFLKDKVPFKKDSIPANIFQRLLDGEKDIDESDTKIEGPVKFCLFCKAPCKLTRFINMQTIYLCDEHYQNKNIGQIAHKMKETGSERQEQTEEIVEENGQEE